MSLMSRSVLFSFFHCFFFLLLSTPCAGSDGFRGWKVSQTHHVAKDSPISFRVGLKQQGLQQLEKILYEVSDPTHPHYGQFLNAEQIANIVSPPPTAIDMVQSFVNCSNNTEELVNLVTCSLTVHRDFLDVTTTVQMVENLFNVTILPFTPPTSMKEMKGRVLYRSPSAIQIPPSIEKLIDLVVGVSDFPDPIRPRVRSLKAETDTNVKSAGWPGATIDPNVLKQLYGIQRLTGPSHTTMSAAEFEGEQFRPADIAAFEKQFNLSPQTVNTVGSNNGGYYGEGTLDMEYLIGTAPGINTTWWGVKGSDFSVGLLQFCTEVLAASDPPMVHSISWGSSEADSASYSNYVPRTNTEFMKMGVAGMSVFAASGDAGTGAQGFFCSKFDPNWPGTSPYLTAVGGTYLSTTTTNNNNSNLSGNVEIGWTDSGGGFSNVFSRPAYQEAAVKKYLAQSNLPAQKYWNASGRAFPDVSTVATNFKVYTADGTFDLVAGTSASTPTFAALIALVNEARVAAGKTTLGFVNPALYQLADGVGTDITQGNNKAGLCPAGFPATPGWDAVTGLGTPLYDTLIGLAKL